MQDAGQGLSKYKYILEDGVGGLGTSTGPDRPGLNGGSCSEKLWISY